MAQNIPDASLQVLIDIGSWKINVRDENESLSRRDSTVLAGDGIDDIDQALDLWDRMKTPLFQIDTEVTGIVDGHGGSAFDVMTRDDLVALRTLYISKYGDDRDSWGKSKPNEYTVGPSSAEISEVEKLTGEGVIPPTPPTPPTPPEYPYREDLLHYWKMDEESGNRLDTIGGMTMTDASPVASVTAGVPSSFTRAASFGGSSHFAHAKPLLSLTALNFSCSFWLKVDGGTGSPAFLFDWLAGSPISGADLYWQSLGDLLWFRAFGDGALPRGLVSAAVAADAWHHCMFGFDGDDVWLTIDAGAVAVSSKTGEVTLGGEATCYTGNQNGAATPFTGQMCELALWNGDKRAWASELYNSGDGVNL